MVYISGENVLHCSVGIHLENIDASSLHESNSYFGYFFAVNNKVEIRNCFIICFYNKFGLFLTHYFLQLICFQRLPCLGF